jgi:hypothetical protein
MSTVLQARFDENRVKKINRIQQETGMSVSELFRRLVDAAEIKPLEISVNLSANANDDITRQGSNVVVSA